MDKHEDDRTGDSSTPQHSGPVGEPTSSTLWLDETEILALAKHLDGYRLEGPLLAAYRKIDTQAMKIVYQSLINARQKRGKL